MTKNDIRLQYSGFVIFAAKMLSVATGLIFQFMVARTLLPEHKADYDIWFNINDLLAYFVLMSAVLPFWTMRFVARGKTGAIKTGILVNFIISIIATLIYLPLVPPITSALGVSGKYVFLYFLVAIQILEIHSMSVLEACLQAKIPQIVGFGLIVQQVCKVILAYVIIMQLQQPLLGAVVSTMAAFAVQIGYYFKLLARELRQSTRWEYAKEWLKGSVVNIYNVVGNQIAAYVFIMLFAYGGEGARGRVGAAATIINVITYSSFLAYALYPKLLAERKHEDITTSLKMVLMFAIPMTVGAIALSDSYITILTDIYTDASPVLIVLSIDAFITTISGLYIYVLFGVETVDAESKISFKKLVRSRLFITFSLPYLHSTITLPTTFYVLTTFAQNQPLLAALCISIINFSARFAMFLILYVIVRSVIKVDIPWSSIVKYVFASAVMATFLFVIPHPTRIYLTLFVTARAGIIYLAVLLAFDEETRTLFTTLLHEFRERIKR